MNNYSKIILLLFSLLIISGCQSGFFKRSDVKDNPVNVNDRVRKNIEEGRGIRFGKSVKGGVFDAIKPLFPTPHKITFDWHFAI